METSFKWCPECAQYTTHYGVKCAGCDMEKEEVDRIAEEEKSKSALKSTPVVEEEVNQVEDTSEVEEKNTQDQNPVEVEEEAEKDPMESDWILCKEKEVIFGGDSKEECEEELDGDISIIRYAKDLFFCKGPDVTYWIGRPESFEESGMSVQ